jgi:hypothetical protein
MAQIRTIFQPLKQHRGRFSVLVGAAIRLFQQFPGSIVVFGTFAVLDYDG